ncbi:MAG: glycosyltransferase family 39 protein [Alphaproteobacteria bacterium]|nr:glycosyltransferase family 39 protein [Alphaproteobacteria bacterium]
MVSISLFVELLRIRPMALFWAMAGTHAVLWTLVPALVFSAPPGQLPEVLAIGHEFQLGTEFGPPGAFWLAEIVYRYLGLFGVYLLSQICVLVTFWAVLTLGLPIVGRPHAVAAVLLMTGIALFSVPTPSFGPEILATPIWALILMHYWWAVDHGKRHYWYVLGVEAGLLLLVTYAGLILLALLVAFTAWNARTRQELNTVEPWIAGLIATAILFPYLIWLDLTGGTSFLDAASVRQNLNTWARLFGVLVLSHAGLAILVSLAGGYVSASRGVRPELARDPVRPAARDFIYVFALAPAVAMTLFVLMTRRPENFVVAPLVVLSGLAIVVAAGDRIALANQYLIGPAWAALLLLPPVLAAGAVAILPWVYPVDLRANRPAAEMGRFFAENFQRRTGRPLQIVAGDQDLAALIAMTAPSRPSLYVRDKPVYAPTLKPEDFELKGAVVVWPAADTTGRPPPEILRQFPGIVPEVPRAFDRRFGGFLPVLRVGWAMVRPRGSTVPPVAPQ